MTRPFNERRRRSTVLEIIIMFGVKVRSELLSCDLLRGALVCSCSEVKLLYSLRLVIFIYSVK